MSGERKSVQADFLHFNRDMSAALRAVAKKQHIFGQHVSDFFQRRHASRNVGCRRDNDEFRFRAQQRFDVLRADIAVFAERTDIVRDYAALFQIL